PSGSASGTGTSKGIGSLAKKQSDVTRQGTQKLKFTPTLPVRRKKDEVEPEPVATTVPQPTARGRGRGRGGADAGRGRGRGRGGAPPPVEMTASGPFAMGPALAGSQVRRSASRADFTSAIPTSATTSAALGENLTKTAAPALRGLDKGKAKVKEEEEVYSDPDDGVEIIEMNKIRDMDWMAPETLGEDKTEKVKKDKDSEAVDLKNALDLSESEDEEELEDLMEDFAVKNDLDADPTFREDRLYFFQFPAPFPKFTKPNADSSPIDLVESGEQVQAESSTKKVSFAPDTKPALTPASSRPSTTPPEPAKEELVDGVIGQLEVYKSGVVKIRLANGILLDVNAATQPSFLQQAVHLDTDNKRLTVLGEVNKQFVVSPDVDSLLETLERQEQPFQPAFEGADELISMDTT
ncbi:DNA-directed RNA polymerase III subunit rpc4, partial [Leucoagaricus sp. SymC.cos]